MPGIVEEIEEFAKAVDAETDPPALWQLVLDFMHEREFPMISYYYLPRRAGTTEEARIIADGYPTEWVCNYIKEKLFLIDPLPGLAQSTSKPFLWSEIEKLKGLSDEETDFVESRQSSIGGDGLAVQVFGPNFRNGCFGVGFGDRTFNLSPRQIRELQIACQFAHLRYCTLVEDGIREEKALSMRESEILEWIARGKSNATIAIILGISNHTVDTHVRRIFAKLDAGDRVTAAIRGIGSGLIKGVA
ncbi:LuxR family transcriptional regulator [Rhodobacteraceae bacterium NNCM2]|nr:LuxR family transcriptional regulator [Coraliihabitans acroporae]